MSEELIKLSGIGKDYRLNRKVSVVVDKVDLSIGYGQVIGFFGPSGSGKTSLLNIIGLIDRATRGEYHFMGQPIDARNRRGTFQIRRRYFGFVLQRGNFIDALSVEENLLIYLYYRGHGRREAKDIVERVLSQFALEPLRRQRTGQLSGGQQQRVALARAFCGHSRLILADEPTSSLDRRLSHEMSNLLRATAKAGDTSVVLVTHDPEMLRYCDAVYAFEGGRVSLEPDT